MVFAIFMSVFLSTVVYDGRTEKALTHFIPSLGLIAFVYVNQKKVNAFLNVIYKVGSTLLVCNLISVVMFPDGIVYREANSIRVWVLGQKQDLGGFVIPFLFVTLILDAIKNNKRNDFFWISYVLCFMTCFIEKSLGAVLTLVILGLLIIFDKYVIKLNRMVLIFLLCIAFILIQYVSYNFNNMPWLKNFMSDIVTYGVSKFRTLNVRFSMWKFAADTFMQYPLFGVGKLTPERWITMSGLGYHSMMDNMYIDIIFTGGIVAFTLFIWLILRSFNSLKNYWKEREVRQMGYCFFALCILLFEGCPYFPFVYLLLTLPVWIKHVGIIKKE